MNEKVKMDKVENIKIMEQKITTWNNIPDWAIYALEYGVNEADLMDEEITMINTFIQNNFPQGYTMSVNWDQCNEFDRFPAFGLACKTYVVVFVTD